VRKPIFIASILIVQTLCALFFVSDILSAFFGFSTTPLPWELREVMEIFAAFGLVVGVVLGAVLLRLATADRRRAEVQLRRASSAFMQLLAERMAEWGLTPAERDVALFAIKGMSTAEIAALRSTSEGTIKAQTNAIYRKAGVTGRAQLISLFIEDLIDKDSFAESGVPRPSGQGAAA
jgi:DNA-binding CsgD family transcriptional regulator